MKLEVNEKRELILKEVYNGVGFESNDGEFFRICMRDSGFEFNYMGTWYKAKNGIVKKLESEFRDLDNKDIPVSNG